MCFAHDALPPDLPAELARPPMAGGAADEIFALTSADGTRFSAALAEAVEPRDPAVLILPDVRGLYRFYVVLAERFAQAGHHAIVIDYFGRTAGTGERGEDFDFMPHVAETRVEQVQADALAALSELRERTRAQRTASVGFCFGGAQSFAAATSPALGLEGAVGFYGLLRGGRAGRPSVLDHVAEARCPILGLFGGADQAIPEEDVHEFDRRLTQAGVEHEVVIYPGAPHSFFERSSEAYAEASADAWRRVLSFLQRLPAPARA
jgi:carboxymethylenebutenolidase